MAFAYIHHSHDARQRGQLEDANWLAYSQQLQERVHQRYLDRRFKRIVECANETERIEQAAFVRLHTTEPNPKTNDTILMWEKRMGPQDRRPTFGEAIERAGVTPHAIAQRGDLCPKHIYRYARCQAAPGPEMRQRLAMALYTVPAQIRWPVRVSIVLPDNWANTDPHISTDSPQSMQNGGSNDAA